MAARRIFYGWWVALAFSLIIFLSTGIRFTVGPFLKPVVADLGLDRASFSLVVSLSLFLYGAFMPLVGRLVDRFGSRLVVTAGTLILAGSLVATGRATTLWQLYFFYGILAAVGMAATGQVVGSAIVVRWFVKRRGTAVGLLSSAAMAGMTFLVPVAMWLILAFGWRTTYVFLGVFTLLLILPLSLWVLRDAPEAVGGFPDGHPFDACRAGFDERRAESTPVSEALGARPFWQLAGGLFTCGFSMSFLSAHSIPMLTDHGFHPMTASGAIGLLGGSSIAGALLLGALSDRVGRKHVLASVYLLRALAFGLLFVVRDPFTLMAVAAISGFGMAGSLAMTSALTGDIFGRFSVGAIFGAIFLSHQTGAALGSWLPGLVFDLSGGYGSALAVVCGLLVLGAALSLGIDERPRRAPAFVPVIDG